MREWIKRKVRQWAKLPAAAPTPRDSRPDSLVFGHGRVTGSPPTSRTAVSKVEDRAYNDPLTDMVTMGIIMSSAQDDTSKHHSHSSHDYGSSHSSSYDSGSSYSDSGSSSSGGFD